MSLTLYVDTETSGLVETKLPASHPAQPHLVQLGLVLMDEARELATVELVVLPEGYVIPDRAAQVHGITTETAYGSSRNRS